VWGWLRSLLGTPRPAGPPSPVRAFGPADRPITQDGVTADGGGWRVESREARTVRLFEVAEPGAERCMLTYRARLKVQGARGRVYLEMWCRLPGRGEFFSKGLHHAVTGTAEWASYEVPFRLEQGQRPDLLKLNLVTEGAGTVWIADVEVLKTPLA
jgi:hypothetical protein